METINDKAVFGFCAQSELSSTSTKTLKKKTNTRFIVLPAFEKSTGKFVSFILMTLFGGIAFSDLRYITFAIDIIVFLL